MTVSRTNVDSLLEDLARLDERQGPAETINSAQAQALVRGAMLRSGVLAPGQQAFRRRSARVLLFRRGVVLGAGVVAATTAAAALGMGIGGGWLARWTSPNSVGSGAVVSGQPNPANGGSRTGTQVAVQATRPTTSVNGASPAAGWHVPTEGSPRAVSPPSPAHETTGSFEPGPAVDLLAQANQHRRQRQYRRALHAYLEVIRRYPGSRQAEAARVAAAALRLEHLSDARGAAKHYRAAASGEGQLGEEAAYGLAEAHRAAGRHDAEQKQLRYFLEHYSTSPLATAARQRLQELERHGR
jgi:TolA-binding protein